MRLLLAEDERDLSGTIKRLLEHMGYDVDCAYDGEEAITYAATYTYDGIILDVMMPKKDGFAVVKELRQKGSNVPVLMLTARSAIDDKVLGLENGADDYLTKPFVVKEFLARVKALVRRRGEYTEGLRLGNMTLDEGTYELSTEKGKVRLTNKEFRLMEYLIRNKDILLSTEKIMENVWDYDTETEINVVWVYISSLRKKMDKIGTEYCIKVMRGVGYGMEKRC